MMGALVADLTKREERDKLRQRLVPTPMFPNELALLDACDELERQRNAVRSNLHHAERERDAALEVLGEMDAYNDGEPYPLHRFSLIREKAREVLRAAERLK